MNSQRTTSRVSRVASRLVAFTAGRNRRHARYDLPVLRPEASRPEPARKIA
jgi:hypothetical protein